MIHKTSFCTRSIDGESIASSEGITQGDPLAMVIYAVGIIPLTWKLDCTDKERYQVWFADDASGTGSL